MPSKYASAFSVIAKAPALSALIAGGLTYGGIRSYKDLKNQAVDNKASRYDRSIARNLRRGKLTYNNLSEDDTHLVDKMYKISSLNKESWLMPLIGAGLNVSMGLGVAGDAKNAIKKNKLDFSSLSQGQYKI